MFPRVLDGEQRKQRNRPDAREELTGAFGHVSRPDLGRQRDQLAGTADLLSTVLVAGYKESCLSAPLDSIPR